MTLQELSRQLREIVGESARIHEDLPTRRLFSRDLAEPPAFFRRFFLKAGTPPYYLLLTKLNPEFNSEEFIALINLLKEIIYK